MIIAVDFDGTLCENAWPDIGAANKTAIMCLQEWQSRGDSLILWTCRVGDKLDAAVKWCAEHGLVFDAVNENLPSIIRKFGGDCRKIYADLYIVDKGIMPHEMAAALWR